MFQFTTHFFYFPWASFSILSWIHFSKKELFSMKYFNPTGKKKIFEFFMKRFKYFTYDLSSWTAHSQKKDTIKTRNELQWGLKIAPFEATMSVFMMGHKTNYRRSTRHAKRRKEFQFHLSVSILFNRVEWFYA